MKKLTEWVRGRNTTTPRFWVRVAACAATTATMAVSTALPVRAFGDGYFELDPDADDFQACAAAMLDEGIAPEIVAFACGTARQPDDLADCVVGIEDVELTAVDVLAACRRTRRPIEVAGCFNQIQDNRQGSEVTVAANVLENCRRSLLPERFADCVVGLRSEIAFPISSAMDNCIAAGNRPRTDISNF
ncbi:MAG: hypothetical protein AAFX78_18785 [Cyanobacteria bacterium J06638_20]